MNIIVYNDTVLYVIADFNYGAYDLWEYNQW